MNCCDYDCTQGRDCPARTQSAKVAKVKSSKPRYTGTPNQAQRNARLRILTKWMLIVWAMLALAALTVSLARGMA